MAQRRHAPLVGVVMGSDSDWDIMRHAAVQLDAFGISYEPRVLSAHRMPDDMFEYAEDAGPRGLRCIIAGAGGAAHLPGMLAAKTVVPVLGVPVPSKYLRGEDSLYSIVQMPKGIPVATFAIGEAGAANAGLFAAAMIAATDPAVAKRLAAFRVKQTNAAGRCTCRRTAGSRRRSSWPVALPIAPGAWLGLLGGGQLGRMFAMAAQSLGYKVVVLDPARTARPAASPTGTSRRTTSTRTACGSSPGSRRP